MSGIDEILSAIGSKIDLVALQAAIVVSCIRPEPLEGLIHTRPNLAVEALIRYLPLPSQFDMRQGWLSICTQSLSHFESSIQCLHRRAQITIVMIQVLHHLEVDYVIEGVCEGVGPLEMPLATAVAYDHVVRPLGRCAPHHEVRKAISAREAISDIQSDRLDMFPILQSDLVYEREEVGEVATMEVVLEAVVVVEYRETFFANLAVDSSQSGLESIVAARC